MRRRRIRRPNRPKTRKRATAAPWQNAQLADSTCGVKQSRTDSPCVPNSVPNREPIGSPMSRTLVEYFAEQHASFSEQPLRNADSLALSAIAYLHFEEGALGRAAPTEPVPLPIALRGIAHDELFGTNRLLSMGGGAFLAALLHSQSPGDLARRRRRAAAATRTARGGMRGTQRVGASSAQGSIPFLRKGSSHVHRPSA